MNKQRQPTKQKEAECLDDVYYEHLLAREHAKWLNASQFKEANEI